MRTTRTETPTPCPMCGHAKTIFVHDFAGARLLCGSKTCKASTTLSTQQLADMFREAREAVASIPAVKPPTPEELQAQADEQTRIAMESAAELAAEQEATARSERFKPKAEQSTRDAQLARREIASRLKPGMIPPELGWNNSRVLTDDEVRAQTNAGPRLSEDEQRRDARQLARLRQAGITPNGIQLTGNVHDRNRR